MEAVDEEEEEDGEEEEEEKEAGEVAENVSIGWFGRSMSSVEYLKEVWEEEEEEEEEEEVEEEEEEEEEEEKEEKEKRRRKMGGWIRKRGRKIKKMKKRTLVMEGA